MAHEWSARVRTKRLALPDAEFNSASGGDNHFVVNAWGTLAARGKKNMQL
jgi:hypothetical protein